MTKTAPSQKKVLIIDQATVSESGTRTALSNEDYRIDIAESGSVAMKRLSEEFDLLIAPDLIDDRSAVEFTTAVRHRYPNTGIIVVTTESNESQFAAALVGRTDDYILTASSQVRIQASVRRVLQSMQMKSELTVLRQTVAMSNGFDNLVGLSDEMIKVKETVRKLGPTDITVMITGPSGSGKELLARIMHHHSRRRTGPFVAIDFSAQTAQVAAEQLFGSERDGTASAASLISQADGGTLFLDNVESVPVDLQPQLARFLTDFTVAANDNGPSRKVDIRVMAASGQDIAKMTTDGQFDTELWSLISEIKMSLPSLARRPEDIELLCEYFLRRLPSNPNRSATGISRDAIEKLLLHDWPGNVRELETCISRAATLCRTDLVQPEDITFASVAGQNEGRREIRILNTRRQNGLLDDTQRSIIARALEDNNWNFTQTAQELGIGRTTLWRKVKKYQLSREQAETVA